MLEGTPLILLGVATDFNPLATCAGVEPGLASRYKAAAPVTKCVFLAISHQVKTDPVQVSNPLNLFSNVAAPPNLLRRSACLGVHSNGGRG